MATGFPANTAFTNGNTLSASDLNDITGNLNLIIPQTTTTLAWQTWSPTAGGGWANGNGTYVAYYTQIGKLVIASLQFTVGSTTTKGSTLTFTLPVTAARATGQTFSARYSAGGTTYSGGASILSTTTITMAALNASGTYLTTAGITATVPGTWATSDTIQTQFYYEAA